MPDSSPPPADRTVEHATCLGCGCACDDITVVVRAGRIAETRQACELGRQWFGDGSLPAQIKPGDRGGDVARAISRAALYLRDAERVLVYLAADVPCETQRAAIAIADVLGAAVDSITSATVGPAILAAQRRGRTGATLGEIRNRADVVVFWGIDPAHRYPRYMSRYLPDAEGLFVPRGRGDRTLIAVDIGPDRGPPDADVRAGFSPDEEVSALGLIRAALKGRAATGALPDSLDGRAAALAERLRAAKYLALVADGEPSSGRDPGRSEALIALAETLNTPTRCALSTLRGGGNRTGADAVMCWQTGYPMAVDFARGAPAYRPADDAATLLARGEISTVLVVGSPTSVPEVVRARLGGVLCIAIGPRASESSFPTVVAIDTGVAGIHERGTAVRLDDIPLPLRPALEGADAAAYHERPVSASYAVAADTVNTIVAGLGLAGSGSQEASPAELARIRRASPEVVVMDALAAAGRPQDSCAVVRALAATVSVIGRVPAGSHPGVVLGP